MVPRLARDAHGRVARARVRGGRSVRQSAVQKCGVDTIFYGLRCCVRIGMPRRARERHLHLRSCTGAHHDDILKTTIH